MATISHDLNNVGISVIAADETSFTANAGIDLAVLWIAVGK